MNNRLTVSVQSIFPVGSCYMTTTNTNPLTILGFGTWSLLASSIDVNGYVYGNGKTLALTNGTDIGALGSKSATLYARLDTDQINVAPNTSDVSGNTEVGGYLGVPTKSQIAALGTGFEDASGLVADTVTCYIWKRTA